MNSIKEAPTEEMRERITRKCQDCEGKSDAR